MSLKRGVQDLRTYMSLRRAGKAEYWEEDPDIGSLVIFAYVLSLLERLLLKITAVYDRDTPNHSQMHCNESPVDAPANARVHENQPCSMLPSTPPPQ
jgi:hypothetical protein